VGAESLAQGCKGWIGTKGGGNRNVKSAERKQGGVFTRDGPDARCPTVGPAGIGNRKKLEEERQCCRSVVSLSRPIRDAQKRGMGVKKRMQSWRKRER